MAGAREQILRERIPTIESLSEVMRMRVKKNFARISWFTTEDLGDDAG
jgi:hypothetical protein